MRCLRHRKQSGKGRLVINLLPLRGKILDVLIEFIAVNYIRFDPDISPQYVTLIELMPQASQVYNSKRFLYFLSIPTGSNIKLVLKL